MNENKNVLQSRLYLDAAKYHYLQMEVNLQDGNAFPHSLLAFLSIARSVTFVFQEQFNEKKRLMGWYDTKVKEWENNKVMNFFKKLRDISIHQHTPDTRTRRSMKWVANLPAIAEGDVMTMAGPNGKPLTLFPMEPRVGKVTGYLFVHDFKWFNEIPDVMSFCKQYLDELEKFVSEAEHILEKEGVKP